MARVTNQSVWLTVHGAAKELGVSSDTIRRWHKKGLVTARIGERGERLFSIKEIERIINKSGRNIHQFRIPKAKSTNLKSIELFAGAGGLALGMHNAGIKSELLVDIDSDCAETVQLNRPSWNYVCKSVADLDLREYRGSIDVMAGGFPCQAFSFAGNKRGFEDARGTLFYDFARLISQVKPRLVLGENVRGLLNHDGGKTLKIMTRILFDLGYEVQYRLLRAQFLDVPQKRERLIIFGVLRNERRKIVFPVEKDYIISLREALRDVPPSKGMSYTKVKARVMACVPEGGYWRDLPPKIQREYMGASYYLGGGKTGMARRLSWDEPSLTLTCNPAQKQTERCHPSETRPLSVREYARIQCFPDDWEFAGSIASQYRQIGNAIPVNLGYHLGLAIREVLGVPVAGAPLATYFRPGITDA
jgi:DNA (cytosine-5)-methyltransferase 1